MSNFLNNALDNMQGNPAEEEEVIKQTEEVVEDVVIEEATQTEEAVVKETVEEAVEEQEVLPTKKEIDYKSWLEENESTIKTYLNEKSTDYTSLDKTEVVRLKLKNDNPELDDNEIEEEMQDRYGLGLQKKSIDRDEMDDEQIEEAEAYNKQIDKLISKGNRELKKDAAIASKFFEDRKGTFELPKFEVEDVQSQSQTQTFDPAEYEQSIIKQQEEYKEKTWIPQLKTIIDPLENLQDQVEFEDNGNKVVLDIDYKLSKAEKEEIFNHLVDYTAHPSDVKYVDDKGNVDKERFSADMATQLMYKKLLKTACKEAYVLGRKEFVKNDLVNFDDSGNQRGSGSNETERFDSGFFKAAAANQKRNTL